MFLNKRNKEAKEIAKIEELKNELHNSYGDWIPKAKKLIGRCFGEKSEEYKYISSVKHERVEYKNNLERIETEHNTNQTLLGFLDDCIKSINDEGLYKEYDTEKSMMSMIKNIAIIIPIVGAIGSAGFFLGRSEFTTEIKANKVKTEALMDSLKKERETNELKTDSITTIQKEIDSLYQILPSK